MKLLFILCLPILILSASIEWRNVTYFHSKVESYAMSLVSPDGSVHIFWQTFNEVRNRAIRYRKMLQDGAMTSTQNISKNYTPVVVRGGLSAKISEDGKHLVVAFVGYRMTTYETCEEHNTSGCMEIFFIESTDGGENWESPIRMNRANMSDKASRLQPAILLEDTKRVYVMYTLNSGFAISVREPNAKNFDNERSLNGTYQPGP